jgi:hypothetical protein
MKLPDNAIGISDIKQWRDCPSRMDFGLARFREEGERPEAQGPNTAYGSAIHHAIELAEIDLLTNDEAIQAAFDKFGRWLGPEHLELMEQDMETYRQRDYKGVKTVSVEDDFRIPMFDRDGVTYYFRFKLDRLYQRLDRPTTFIHIDYKSSAWRKTSAEVHADEQMWAYNFGIYEIFPECQDLIQLYDQLRFGVEPTRKSAEQRLTIKGWLIKQMKAILADEDPEPSFNMWCPYCPLLESCPEPRRTAEFARARIAALAPEDTDTSKLILDPDLIETYVTEAENAATVRKALERFEKAVKGVLRDMPEAKRLYHGYGLKGKQADVWTPEAMRVAHEVMGDEFYALVKVTKGRVSEYLKGDDRRQEILDLAIKEGSNPTVTKL